MTERPRPAPARPGRHIVKEVFRFRERERERGPARDAQDGARDDAEGPDHYWEVWRVEAPPSSAGAGAGAGGRETRTEARFRTAREAEAWIAARDGPGRAADAGDGGGADDAGDAGDGGGA